MPLPLLMLLTLGYKLKLMSQLNPWLPPFPSLLLPFPLMTLPSLATTLVMPLPFLLRMVILLGQRAYLLLELTRVLWVLFDLDMPLITL
jgi:hypothetical protein